MLKDKNKQGFLFFKKVRPVWKIKFPTSLSQHEKTNAYVESLLCCSYVGTFTFCYWCICKSFFLSFTAVARLRSSWALAFLTFSLHNLTTSLWDSSHFKSLWRKIWLNPAGVNAWNFLRGMWGTSPILAKIKLPVQYLNLPMLRSNVHVGITKFLINANPQLHVQNWDWNYHSSFKHLKASTTQGLQ